MSTTWHDGIEIRGLERPPVFRAFESSLARGLLNGQVLTCELAIASAVNLMEPQRGPWVLVTESGKHTLYKSPLTAARAWCRLLNWQIQIDNDNRTC